MSNSLSAPSIADDMLTSLSLISTGRRPDSIQTPKDPRKARLEQILREKPDNTPKNPLLDVEDQAAKDIKSIFLALHVLFPHELLPALDLLDRGLITRLISSDQPKPDDHNITDTTSSIATTAEEPEVFYIQSASAITDHQPSASGSASASRSFLAEKSGRFRNAMTGRRSATQTFYEVRLDSWNCSCAAFAFSAFGELMKEVSIEDNVTKKWPEVGPETGLERVERDSRTWRVGGLSTRSEGRMAISVCKHILAAVLAKAAPQLFMQESCVKVRKDVRKEEFAGWGAGWGDGG